MQKNTMPQGEFLANAIKAAFCKAGNKNSEFEPLLNYWLKLSSEVGFIDLEVAINMAAIHAGELLVKWECWSLATKNPKMWFMCEMAKEEWQKPETMSQFKALLIEIVNKSIPEPNEDEQWDYETLDGVRAGMLELLFCVHKQQQSMAAALLLLSE